MKFLIVLDSFNIGGAERQSWNLAMSLKSKGHEVQFIALTEDGNLRSHLEKENVPFQILGIDLNFGKINFPKSLMKLRKAIKSVAPDIIFPYTYWPNIMAAHVWKYTGAKKCFWNQRDEFPFQGVSQERKAIAKASVIVANSEGGKAHLEKAFGLPADKVKVIHNGVQLSAPMESTATWKSKLGLTEDTFAAVMVANLQRRKNHPTLVKAWKKVVDQAAEKGLKKPVLLLAGRFAGKHFELKALAFDLGFTTEIQFLDEVKDLAGLMSACDISVFSSFHEGCPNGVLEPMAAGLAVVANNIQGCQEALGANYSALVESDNEDAFAAKILELMQNETLRNDLGAANKQRINAEFSIEHMTNQYLKYAQ